MNRQLLLTFSLVAAVAVNALASDEPADYDDYDDFEDAAASINEGSRRLQRHRRGRPSWWRTYKSIYGRSLHSCRRLDRDGIPANGAACPDFLLDRQQDSAFCLFGEQSCMFCQTSITKPLQSCHCLSNIWMCHDVSPCTTAGGELNFNKRSWPEVADWTFTDAKAKIELEQPGIQAVTRTPRSTCQVHVQLNPDNNRVAGTVVVEELFEISGGPLPPAGNFSKSSKGPKGTSKSKGGDDDSPREPSSRPPKGPKGQPSTSPFANNNILPQGPTSPFANNNITPQGPSSPPAAGHPPCSVCGPGARVGMPKNRVTFPSQPTPKTYTCERIQEGGRSGSFTPTECSLFPMFLGETCGCIDDDGSPSPTTNPTTFPTAFPTFDFVSIEVPLPPIIGNPPTPRSPSPIMMAPPPNTIPEAIHPSCSVCGNGTRISLPREKIQFPSNPPASYTCAQIQEGGEAGMIAPVECDILPLFIGETCGCIPDDSGISMPSLSPPPPRPVNFTIAPVVMPVAPPQSEGTPRPTDDDLISIPPVISSPFMLPPPPKGPPPKKTPQPSISSPTSPSKTPEAIHPPCSVCGNGTRISLPREKIQFPSNPPASYTCAQIQEGGEAGMIAPDECDILPLFIGETCGCIPDDSGISMPSLSPPPPRPVNFTIAPVVMPVAPPQEGTPRPTNDGLISTPPVISSPFMLPPPPKGPPPKKTSQPSTPRPPIVLPTPGNTTGPPVNMPALTAAPVLLMPSSNNETTSPAILPIIDTVAPVLSITDDDNFTTVAPTSAVNETVAPVAVQIEETSPSPRPKGSSFSRLVHRVFGYLT